MSSLWPLVFADSRVVEEEGRSSLEDNSDIIHRSTEKVKVLVAESCPTPFDPVDCSLPGSSVRGILRQEYWSG